MTDQIAFLRSKGRRNKRYTSRLHLETGMGLNRSYIFLPGDSINISFGAPNGELAGSLVIIFDQMLKVSGESKLILDTELVPSLTTLMMVEKEDQLLLARKLLNLPQK